MREILQMKKQNRSIQLFITDQPKIVYARMVGVDDDTYIFTVRGWCKSENYWPTYFNLIENCAKALADNGIDDPEERIAVRLVNEHDKEEEEI